MVRFLTANADLVHGPRFQILSNVYLYFHKITITLLVGSLCFVYFLFQLLLSMIWAAISSDTQRRGSTLLQEHEEGLQCSKGRTTVQ